MEASSSSSIQPPATPSHSSLLPALSPSSELTPAPLHTLPAHLQHHLTTPSARSGSNAHSREGSGVSLMGPPGVIQGLGPPVPQNGQGVFNAVMGSAPGQLPVTAPAKVYASVYSGIPVFEAMIRGISVMRRSVDSWVNATQILKVAGISKSGRTKILEKEILPGNHEKVQGGYGKYQGTWIPFQRGQELAASYGVDEYLSPIFDFVPSPSAVAALPVIRHGTPPGDRSARTPNVSSNLNPNTGRTPAGSASGSGRMISPFTHGQHGPPPPPPQFVSNDAMMGIPPHPSAMAYVQGQPNMYFQPPSHFLPHEKTLGGAVKMEMQSSHNGGGLAPAPDINGIGLPPSGAQVYLDQYGQPHPIHQEYINGDSGEPPMKRARSDEEGYTGEEMQDDDDDESIDELRNAPPLPSSMRLANKPLRPKSSGPTSRARSKLLSLFSIDEPVDVRAALELSPEQQPDFDVDMVIDDQGHTALHWACALAKQSIATQLIELGADIYRGNYAGETALIRSVLTTNHAEGGTFGELLEHSLAPSIRTLDHAYRTVLHHVALIAGVKGRAASARAYMAGILEWIAKERITVAGDGTGNGDGAAAPQSLKALVDIQDVHGDTALNVAARVGNKGLVKLLLDAGADKAKANKLGLKPADFGVETEALRVSSADAVISSLKSEAPKPEKQSRDVQKNIAAIFETINETFSNEMLAKQTKLNATEASVRHATRALADKRQQVERAQEALGELEQLEQKTVNLKRALSAPLKSEDWIGRIVTSEELNGQSPLNPAFAPLPPHALTPTLPIGVDFNENIPIPERGVDGVLVQLRRVGVWEDRVSKILEERITALEGESLDRAVKYRKLVALCAKVPVEKVDGMLDGLTTAIQSDGQSIDLSRVSNFMSRMKETQV